MTLNVTLFKTLFILVPLAMLDWYYALAIDFIIIIFY